MRDVQVAYQGATADLSAAVADVRVQLQYIPAGPRMMTAPGTDEEVEVETHLLVLRTEPDGGLLTAGGTDDIATVLSVDRRRELPTRLYSVLRIGLNQWMNDNLAAFQHVFAAVNVVKSVGEDTSGGFDWLKPTSVSYAFGHNARTPEDSTLSILCMSGGNSADGLIAQAQADMVPDGADAALCISRQRLAQDMIGKGIPLAFDGLEKKHISYTNKGTTVNVNKSVQLENVKDPDSGRTYAPVLKRMEVRVGETDVRLDTITETKITAGVWSIINSIDTFTYGLSVNSKNQKTLAFKQLTHDDKRQTREEKSAKIWEWVTRGLAFVGLAALTVLSGGVFAVVAVVTAALLVGNLTRDAIKLTRGNDGPPIDLMLTNATQAVTWSTAQRFDPVFAGLNGGLQIGGLVGRKGLLGAEDPSEAQKAFQAPFSVIMAARASGKAS